jgi:hypothetical protein
MLNPRNLGLAGGILWGLSVFVLTFISMATGMWAGLMDWVGLIYPGYSVSAAGAFIGFVYGFADMFVCLYLFGLLYNYLEGMEKKR